MITGSEFVKLFSEAEGQEVEEKLFSTGNEELDALLERVYSAGIEDGYSYAQKEFTSKATKKAIEEIAKNQGMDIRQYRRHIARAVNRVGVDGKVVKGSGNLHDYINYNSAINNAYYTRDHLGNKLARRELIKDEVKKQGRGKITRDSVKKTASSVVDDSFRRTSNLEELIDKQADNIVTESSFKRAKK